jgi:predicted dehydrogenase
VASRESRRRFLKQGTLAGLTILAGPGLARTYAASAKLNIALIGVGGRGGDHYKNLFAARGAARDGNLVAFCDADQGRMAKAIGEHPDAKAYTDYRRLFDAHKDLNTVFVATPDHNHFPAAIRAIEGGAGVYCEKPMTWSVWEARALTEAARRKKVASQLGNQGHSGEGVRRLCEVIWAGLIGDVTEVHCATTWDFAGDSEAKRQTQPVPPGLDWEAWLGPAPWREYHTNLHPFAWRGWIEFGTGSLGDQGCHVTDPAFWALKLAEAETVEIEAESSPLRKETFPTWAIVTYRFPARGQMAPVTLKWFMGPKRPPLPPGGRGMAHGSYFYGTKANLMAGQYGDGVRIIPEEKHKELESQWPPKTLPRSRKGHWGDFLEACRGGPPAASNFDYSGPLTELVLAGNLALRTGKRFTWRVRPMEAVNCPEAQALVKRQPRKGWEFGY